MRLPGPFKDFLPIEAIKQLSQLVAQPALVNAIKETAQKIGMREPLSSGTFQQILQQAGRWMESVSEPWLHGSNPGLKPGVNGTGELFSGRWSSSRLGEPALQQLHLLYRHYSESTKLESQLRDLLVGMTGAHAALVFPNMSIALHAIAFANRDSSSLSNQVENRSPNWVLPRVDCIRIPQAGGVGGHIRNVLDVSGAATIEIGSIQECSASDFRSAIVNQDSRLLMVSPNALSSEQQSVHRDLGYSVAKQNEAQVVELILDASLHDLSHLGFASRVLPDCWNKNTEFMVVPGDGFLGGPECGIALGTKEAIEKLSKVADPLGWYASAVTKAALLRTLQTSSTIEDWKQLPIGQALSTSMDNMKNRAQRLSNQLSMSSHLSKSIVETRSCKIGAGAWSSVRADSAVIKLFPSQGTASQLAERISQGETPIWANIQSDHVELVMRSIEPDEDRLIVNNLCNSKQADSDGPTDPCVG